jgi:hypothetical protein
MAAAPVGSPALAPSPASRRRLVLQAGGLVLQAAADLGGHPGAVGPARDPGGHRLHDLAHARHPARSGLGDRRVHQCGEFIVAELRWEVDGQDIPFGALGRRLLSAPGGAERLGGLPPLPRLTGEHFDDLVVAEVAG